MTAQLTGMLCEACQRVLDYLASIRSLVKSIIFAPRSGRLEFCRPGLRFGNSPLRHECADRSSSLDRMINQCLTYRERHWYTQASSIAWLDSMAQLANKLDELTPYQLETNRAAIAQRMRCPSVRENGNLDEALMHASIAVRRTQQLTPRANQYLAARAMLRGHFVEMATGEGKTLSVAMAAAAAALSGTPVHVLTANDYLAERDASYLKIVYQYLGLQVACVLTGQNPAERRQAYTADIVYVTAKQVAFDWLKDAVELGAQPDSLSARLSVLTQTTARQINPPMLRGLCLAFVDEADSLLVDEARTPLVLATARRSGSADEIDGVIALGLAEQLREGIDFEILSTARLVRLTDSGRKELGKISQKIAHSWQSSRFREERVRQALTVLHRFKRDTDYIVREDQLELIDSQTGRAMPDRRLPHGLHLLLELKEKCPPSQQHETVTTVTFQHFFRRYIGLAGISGTLKEVAGEIHHVYDHVVIHIPSHRPSHLMTLPVRVFKDCSAQLHAMVQDVRQRHESEQPVLVCTRSVEQSLRVSAILTARNLPHRVLNAYQDAEEAEIVAAAGQAGQVTVATNMAGRGTDIPLDAPTKKSGGLHVISLAFNDASRLDRQLAGRAARQGDPGSYQQFFSITDPYLKEAMPAWMWRYARTCVTRGWQQNANMSIHLAQKQMEWKHRKERSKLNRSQEVLARQLAFAGNSNNVP